MNDGERSIDMDDLMELTELQKVLQEYAREAEEMYKYQLSLGKKTASRQLIDGVRSQVVVGEQSYEVTLTLQEYWKYIEYGRQGVKSSPLKAHKDAFPPGKAAFPPVKAIMDWILVKPILPRPDDDGKMQQLKPKSLAFLIGRKIYEEGIQPHPALHQTQEELNKIYGERIAAALGHDIGIYLRKVIAAK